MSVIWIDGFNQYGGSTSALRDIPEYTGSVINLSTGDYGYEVRLAFNNGFMYTLDVTQTTLVMGCRFLITGSNQDFLFFKNSSNNNHCSVVLGTSSELSIYDSTGTLKASSASLALPSSTYVYLEVKLILNTSVEVRVNGKTVVSDATGDYQHSSEIAKVYFDRGTADQRIDNFYVTDSEFLGEIIVKTYYPDADGTHGDFEPSTGVDHYAVVDEVPPSDSDYLLGIAADEKESFTTTPTLEGPIKAVMVMNRVAKDGGLGAKVKNLVRVGGVDYLGSNEKYLGSDPQYLTELLENNPNTSNPWSIAEAEAIEFGLQITGLSTTTTTV